MSRRESYQQGSIGRKSRKKGPDVWVFRYYEYDLKGKRTRRSPEFSDTDECPTKAHAERKAERLRQKINNDLSCVFFSNLADRFEREELPERHCTAASYRSNLKRLRAKWGQSRLDWMTTNTSEIERWLSSLKRMDRPTLDLQHKTKQNIKALLHVMFERAMQWNYLTIQRNPVELARIKGVIRKKRQIPTVMPEQLAKLLEDDQMCPHVRVMVCIAAAVGIRASEFLGLRWEDVDFETGWIHIRRSFVGKHQGATKSLDSEADVPMDDLLATILRGWREAEQPINGYVFGSAITNRPFHRDSLLKDHLQPAAKRVGIQWIGWHSFRHTYRALLAELGEELEVQQFLMRHAHISTTLEYGKQSPQRAKKLRVANAKLVAMLPLAAGGKR